MKTIWSLPTENWMFLEQSSLNLLELSLVQIDHTWHFMNLTSPFNRIYVVFEGEARVSSLDQTIILKPGSVCLIPCGNSYSYECDGQAKKFFAHFTFKFANMDLFYQQPASVRRGTTHELNFFEQFQSNQPLDFQQTFTLKAKLLNLFAGNQYF